MRRLLVALFLPLALAACGAEPVWAPDEEVQRMAYRHDAPASLSLITVVSNENGSGGHSALLVNASQRVIFDPAGTWHHPQIPERNDVHFGMQPAAFAFYKDYHARETWHVVTQEVRVPPEVAELALRRVQDYGPVPKAYCAQATTEILSGLPGFEDTPRGFSPIRVMNYMAAKPGVVSDTFYDDSPANNGTIEAPTLRPPS